LPRAVFHEGHGEASAGERAGWPLSRVRPKSRVPESAPAKAGADDIVVGFEHEADAHRFLDMMRARLEEFALTLHPEKTGMMEFGRRAAERREKRGLGKPETLNFLGFTLICGKSRRGKFLLWRKSRRDRSQAKLQVVKEEMRRRMHQSVPRQGESLRQVVTGYFAYQAMPTNIRALQTFHDCVVRLWRRSLRRRGQRDKTTWERIKRLAEDFLPRPNILHSWPEQRCAVERPRWELYAGIPLVRFCAGGAQ
jgi:RNA-directed DNA polymerase